MKTQITTLFLILLMALLSSCEKEDIIEIYIGKTGNSIGDTFIYDEIYYSITAIPENTLEVCQSGRYPKSSVNIKEKFRIDNQVFYVTSIAYLAFAWNNYITSVFIPKSVKSIGEQAFSFSPNITSITFEKIDNITYVGANTFLNPWIAKWIGDQPEGLIYFGKCLYGYNGTNSTNTTIQIKEGTTQILGLHGPFTSINIPNSVTNIEDRAFSDCRNLKSITIPGSVTSIGNFIFQNCSNLNSISLPNSIEQIGESAFDSCYSLTSISIPNSVKFIGNRAFQGCTSLTVVNIPNSVINIGMRAFGGCTNLTSITIPNSVTSISAESFVNCKSLKSINIPGNVTEIGQYAFWDCSSLISLTIQKGVRVIGECAFFKCSNLSKIQCHDNMPPVVWESAFDYVNMDSCVLEIPIGSMSNYLMAREWYKFKIINEVNF